MITSNVLGATWNNAVDATVELKCTKLLMLKHVTIGLFSNKLKLKQSQRKNKYGLR